MGYEWIVKPSQKNNQIIEKTEKIDVKMPHANKK